MQFTPLDKQQRAEWREMLNPADSARIGAAAVLFLLSALALPLARFEAVAGLYLLYAVVFYYTLTHSVFSIVLIALPTVLPLPVCSGIMRVVAINSPPDKRKAARTEARAVLIIRIPCPESRI